MSAFTKVLIVFVLLLSVIFAVAQVMLFREREDFGTKYAESRKELSKLETDLEQTEAELKDVRAERNTWRDRYTEVDTRSNQQIERLTAEKNAQEEQINKLTDRVQELTSLLESEKAEIKEARQTIDEVKEQSLAKDAKLDDLRNEINSLDKRIVELNSTIRSLNQDIIALRTEKQHLADARQELEEQLEEVVQRTGVELDRVQVPPIDAVVVSVSDDQKHVVINKGRRDNVSVGYRFIVHDQQQVLGYFNVNNVLQDTASGRLHTYENRTVESGDMATTKIR